MVRFQPLFLLVLMVLGSDRIARADEPTEWDFTQGQLADDLATGVAVVYPTYAIENGTATDSAAWGVLETWRQAQVRILSLCRIPEAGLNHVRFALDRLD